MRKKIVRFTKFSVLMLTLLGTCVRPLSGQGSGFSVTPSVSVLTFIETQQFTASSGTAVWSVDGVIGGSASTGTVTAGGVYTPPTTVGTHTITATTSSQSASATVYITDYSGTFTYHNDDMRSGANLDETVLTPASVNPNQFGKLFGYTVDGTVYASPLYVPNISIPGQGAHNVVYIATNHDSVYALDADVATTLWHVSFINPAAGVTTIPSQDTNPNNLNGGCCDLLPEVGIVGTPVIDQSSGTMYLVAATKEVSGSTTNYVERLHAIDITSGAEKFGGPVVIQPSVPGTGSGSSGGNVPFYAVHQGQRAGLLLSNGVVYIAFAGHDDITPWHGWVLGYDSTTLQPVMVFNDTPNDVGGGIWQSGGGLATDSTGNLYFSTGNGGFDANTAGNDYGDSILNLSPAGAVLDYFTPHDQANMNANDLDLASGGPVVLVDQSGSTPYLLIAAGKSGTIYVINRYNMGHYNSKNDSQIVQVLPGILPNGDDASGNYNSPVYFNQTLYFGAVADSIKAFTLSQDLLSTGPTSQSSEVYAFPGGAMSVSANGSTNGILWAVERTSPTKPGVLHAYDATNLGQELYNSNQSGSRDTLDIAAKFSVPMVADGRVYIGANSQLLVYGLLPNVLPPAVTSVSPNSGTTAGGTAVTITGTNFVAGATVTFGSTAATNVAVVNGTTITATTPAGSAGAVTVTVTVSGQSGSLANGFTYVGPPTVSSVSPNSGTTAGGTAVTITGTNFAAGATVTFGGTSATNVVVASGTQITATTPAHAAGAVAVAVTVNSQTGTLANGFTYAVGPTVSSVSPNNGPVAGGTAVTITGTNFVAGATVTFGSTAATNVAVVNGTTITATTPAGNAGAVTVTVTVNGQSGSLTNGFTYNAAVAISFTQVASATPQSPTASVPVAFPGAQTTGDLNVVVVGWSDTTSTVQSVKDSAGNTYHLAIGPTVGTGLQQSIYYAANIVGGSNTVTVTFSQAVAYPDIRILEYRGVTALDVTAGTSGSSTAANSGAATTTIANELIFGADVVSTTTAAAGSGFTSRIITVPDGDIAEDKVVTTAGSNSATATLSSAGPWVMQMATFSAVSGPVPTVSSVSPNTGSTTGGTAVTITGTNFVAGATVTFGSTAATNVAVVNGTTITATTPAGSAGAVTVTVTNPGGGSGSLASAFTYVVSPTVSSVSPNGGSLAGGTAVTITGTNFAAGATVTFGSTAATNVAVVNGTTITATTPTGSAGAVTVTVTVNGQSGSLTNGFTYVVPPTVSSVSPNSGTTAGGTAVTITGTNFVAGATVTFGSTAATNVAVVNGTTITATTPAGSAGAVTLTVTVSGQSGSLTSGYTYVVAPTVSSVAPNNGLAAGGTAVTITGTNFAAGATVTFGSTAATNVAVVNGTTITATTPAGSTGAVTVTVTVNGQSGSLANGFTYVVPPTVSSVSPNSGTTAGSTAVTITGTNFVAGATVTFGSTAATNVAVVNGTTITATTPAGNAGAVTVTVTNPGTSGGSLANAFTYVVAPTVSSVAPNNGLAAGGTAVTITGTNFAAGATVTFGGTSATNVVVASGTQITATTPAHAAGAVAVAVTVNSQTGTLANGFTYNAPPTVTSVAPNNGPVAGGTAVTITGTNFVAGATVTFGSTAATNVAVVNGTTITATTPAGNAGAVTVTVTVNGQSGSLTNGFTYNAAVAISFTQVASATPQSPTASVPVAFPGAQTTGDLNVVVVGWSDTTSTVQSVKDSAGNTYHLAIGPTVGTGLQQSIYYAANIVGGSNTVTVTFSQAVAYPDIRILEYRGVTALDVTAGTSGSSTAANSGAATTTVANELIFGADVVSTTTAAAGSGFTSRIITVPDGDIAEDKVVTTAGSNSATATLSSAGPWVMQMATFSAVSGPVPTVSSVSPNTGSTTGGTAVTITGTNFVAGATVTFGSTAATNVAVVNGTTITATTPAGSAGAVTVTVTNPGGGSGSLASAFTYVVSPTVSSVSPNGGSLAGGTAVTITGTNFAAGATVTFGSTAATNVAVVNGTTITATTPTGSAGAVTVTVTVNGQSGSLTNGFTYVVPPTVSSVSPNSGTTAGGTAVTITGTNFVAGATVTFGSTAATNVAVVNGTTITATTPAGSAGAVTLTVTVSGQSGSLTSGYTYVVAPTVSSVAPNNGLAAGGTAVTITGTNFAAGATVTFGSTAATNVAVVNGTTITATTPAGSTGAVTVTVTVNGQSGSLANGFTYVVPPTVSSVSPNSGTTAGSTAVTITGTNFVAGATVTFGSTAATNVAVVNGTTITATTPAGSAGAVTLTVTVSGQSGSLTSGYTYVVAPTVSSVAPNNGLAAGGTAVTITGTNFAAGATVTFGSTAATNVAVVNGTTITATTPAHAAGAVAVAVTVNSQTGTLANGFTYNAPPTVTSVAPNNGPVAGGTAVTITGTNFVAGATVTFGSTAATNVAVVNGTTITATTPAGNAGAVTVTVTNPGTSGGSLANAFTYVVAPTVSSVAPNNGLAAGGTAVTITGTNFAAGATVTFGGTSATNVVVASGTQITATTPAHAAGAVAVAVTVNSQTGTLANGFTYNAPPTVTSVAPNNGPVAGGTAVTITGTNFVAGATVTFGSTAATNVAVVNGTTITATTPAGNAGAVTVTVTVNGQSGSLTNGFTYNAAVAISFTQVASATPQSPTASVPVAFPGAQTTGDLNVVVVGWSDTTSTVQSVKDSAGNTYHLAIGPTVGTGLQQSIYYAANIVGGSNTVTVTFSQAVAYPDIRILEYRGVTALDVTAGTSGSSTAANSGAATTTVANELIFGADVVSTTTAAAGSGFTSRIITVPDGDIAEDKVVTTAGSNSATATLSSAGPWVMQMATFSAVSGPVPTVSSVSPNTGSTTGGTAVTITGTNFVAGATVTFGSTAATNVAVVNGTTITATTPAGSAGAVTVTVTNPGGGSGSLASAFTYVVSPTVSSVSPNGGSLAGGTAVTITGTNFAAGATVTFGSTAATNVAVVNGTTITATTPAGSAGAVTVTVTNSNGLSGSLANAFSYAGPPTVSSVSPNSGTTLGGTAVTITGTNFFTGATVTYGTTAATNVAVVNGTTITAITPLGTAGAVTVTVTAGGQSGSLASGFTYVVTAGITAPGNFAGALMGTAVPTYVSGQQYYNATSGTSFTTSPFNSTGADLLVMFVACHNSTAFTIADSYGNTWLPLAGPALKVGSASYPMEGELFYVPNATTGAGHTITVGLSQSEPLVLSIAALSGDNIFSPIDAYSLITGDNGTIAQYIASSSLTTSQPNDLLLGIVKGFGNNTYTAGTGYVTQSASAGLNFSAETETASTAGSFNSSFTASVSDFWQTVIAAIAPKPTQAVISWTASTGGIIANYLIERCAGLGCSNFSQIASVSNSTLTFTDTSISAGTIYNYRVRAEDSSSTFSPYSNVQALSPVIPHVVSSFSATPVRTMVWGASAESGGSISQYSIERCTGAGCSSFSQIATTSSMSYTDTSAAAGTTYNYRVRAQDANGFYGPYSVVATASIPAYFDNAADGGNNGGSTTSLTYSYTVGTNPNALLLVNLVGDPVADDITSVTYAGASMTLVAKVKTPSDVWQYLYYLLAPASGTHNVAITAAGSHLLASEAASWYNVAQSGQPVAHTTNTAASGVSLTTSLPASSNNAIVAESMWAPINIFPASGSSELLEDSAFQSLGMFSSVPSPVTQAFPSSITNNWGGQSPASSVTASFSLAANTTAGITYDSSADGGNNGGTTASLTYSYSVGSGANRLLVVNLIGDTAADDISSVTYGGSAMTLVSKVQAPSNNWQYLYYLLNPAAGSHTVVITAASSHYLISQAASWYNVRQSAQPDAFTTNTATATSTSITTTLTTVATGALVVQGLWSFGHLAAGAGATPVLTDTAFGSAGIFASSQSPVSPAGNVSMTTISDGSISTGVIMVSFAPAP